MTNLYVTKCHVSQRDMIIWLEIIRKIDYIRLFSMAFVLQCV